MNKWLKWGLVILILAGVSVGCYFILKTLGVTDINSLQTIITRAGAWGWVVFLLLQVLVTTLLCFIPATSMTFISLGIILFGPYKAILICGMGVFLSSMLLFMIGDLGGEKIAKKLVGEESLKKAQDLIDVKSKMFLPLMFLFPIFPDDALCMVAGMTKMKYWYFAIIALVFRTIGVVTICLGVNFIDWTTMRLVDYICLINIFAIDIIFIFKSQDKIEKWLKKKFKKEDKEDE